MKKLGFTLAEVLITLVIIGVIAAMTVPTLMNNTNAQEYRSALKKAISGVNQALTLHYALDGMNASDYANANELVNKVFKKRMSTVDDTTFSVVENPTTSFSVAYDANGTATGTYTVSSIDFSSLNGIAIKSSETSEMVFTTADGMKFYVGKKYYSDKNDSQGSICNSFNTVPCIAGATIDADGNVSDVSGPNLLIDVNGARKPNVITTSSARPRDIYAAMIYAQKVVPWGIPTQEVMFDKEAATTAVEQNSNSGDEG